jgi:hypothetical protein
VTWFAHGFDFINLGLAKRVFFDTEAGGCLTVDMGDGLLIPVRSPDATRLREFMGELVEASAAPAALARALRTEEGPPPGVQLGSDPAGPGEETVPCRWCSRPTTMTGTRECDWCYERHKFDSERGG